MLLIEYSKEKTLVSKLPGKLFWESDAATVGPESAGAKERVPVNVDPEQLDLDLVEELYLPESFSFGNFAQVDSFTEPAHYAGGKVIQHTLRSFIGKIGTMRQFKNATDDIRHAYLKADAVHRHHQTGSLNGDSPMLPPRLKEHGAGAEFFFPPAVLDLFQFGNNPPRLLTNREWALRILPVSVSSPNRIKHAWVQEQFLKILASGSPIDMALRASVRAADRADEGAVTVEDIKKEYCKCDGSTSHHTDHVCMGDCAIRLCSEMQLDTEGRLLCQGCAPRATALEDIKMVSLKKKIKVLAYQAHRVDAVATAFDLPYTSQEIAASLLLSVTSNSDYLDGYATKESYKEAIYKSGKLRTLRCGLTIPHPLQLSLEKAKPLHMANYLAGLHHPDNVLLTELCLNLLKHRDGASALAMLKHVFLLAKAARSKPPVCGYLPEQAEEMEVFERFADNATMIRRTFPHSKAARMATASKPGYQELFDDVIAPQFKTGVWCGFTIRTPFIPPELYLDDMPEITVNGVHFTFWTMEERLELVDIIAQMENDHQVFNPHHLSIPRNSDGSPNLWRECNGAKWEYVWRECVRKLGITDNDCDEDNDTEESPAT